MFVCLIFFFFFFEGASLFHVVSVQPLVWAALRCWLSAHRPEQSCFQRCSLCRAFFGSCDPSRRRQPRGTHPLQTAGEILQKFFVVQTPCSLVGLSTTFSVFQFPPVHVILCLFLGVESARLHQRRRCVYIVARECYNGLCSRRPWTRASGLFFFFGSILFSMLKKRFCFVYFTGQDSHCSFSHTR